MGFTSINEVFEAFNNIKALIIGDVMVDAYDWGKVERISPEAPVPIIHLTKRENRLGGAANVALNIKALGAKPILVAAIGDDLDGDDFLKLMDDEGMDKTGIIRSQSRVTTTKRRVIAGSQHILRIDNETDRPLDESDSHLLLAKIEQLISEVNVVIFEDYDKGVISEKIIAATVAWCEIKNIPIAVDPKKRNFLHYKGVTLFKPNLKELKEGLKVDFTPDSIVELANAVDQLHLKLGAKIYFITLSERGVYIQSLTEKHHIPAHLREISDVSGAGDTVISTASLCLALGLSNHFLAELSNLSGGLVCEYVGVIPINKENLQKEAERLDLRL